MNPENTPVLAPESPKIEEVKKPINWKAVGKEALIFIVIAVGIVLPFRHYVAKPYLVDGRSMDPTFKTGDYLIVNEISYKLGTPKRNSVVVFDFPKDPKNYKTRSFFLRLVNPGKSFIKRIIGLPGETVVMKNGIVTIINSEHPEGFKIDQSYVKEDCTEANKKLHGCISDITKTLSGDEYFVMGDNRAESYDSRYWGPVPSAYIVGKPVLRLLPISQIGLLPGNDEK